LAVTDQGRLVLARAYGLADTASRQPVEPTSLFRIASISKPITAVAILQLVEGGKLDLEEKVFEVLDCESEIEAAGEDFDPRQRQITIGQLLEHRGGWDRDQSFDAMFQSVRFAEQLGVPAPAQPHDIIRAMFRQPLDFDPGERYAYSNFGYSLLGRVVEQRTGQTYESYVQQHVLKPLGIESMRIGATRLSGRAPGEVGYYHPGTSSSVFAEDLGQPTHPCYGSWCLEAMDAHGGWIASAVDLARFAAAFDDPDRCPVLSRPSIERMHARPEGLAGHEEDGSPKDVYYSLGWLNRDVGQGRTNHWHSGSLPGTATLLIRRHDGRNFIALLNSRVSPNAGRLSSVLDGLLHEAANAVTEWPAEDLFQQLGP
jgi:N-acyl-D-amino-acid deacylase